ncbi:phage minor capsid protein [Enterococcus faecium]|uniref:phage minor capsid protein n=1 Tax=Enterococcus faecium TaxID=1352 RepID=UPI000E095773|nr:phage minor capsid protein [Enterococcus faecium]MCM6896563.1 phage minor capsid protein [Enterococcus faecium]MCM6907682.1 phage minor capsid protein [Enterococcus faecium]MCM6926306.1 phage minor capsid protein [Enterococcus faecium]MCM6935883.1 phage minor capsid protein [Enterococcus faecium]RDG15236.1 capsid protein [Enterococcus faecium]
MITPEKMQKTANSIINIYSELEDRIFTIIIKALKHSRFQDVAKEDVLLWQVNQLSKMGTLNDKVIDLLASYTGETQEAIEQLIKGNGVKIVDEIDRELERMVHKSIPVSDDVNKILDSLVRQTFQDLNNNVNQTLITTNFNENAVMRAYQAILKQSTIESMTGLKTHEKAVKDNVYKMVDMGIKSGFVDKAGREWSMEAYSRTVVQTTSHRTFNDLRLQRMEDFECVTALMSSHPTAREACAPIQGDWVLTVPKEEAPEEFKHLPSIYDHGYGEPSGTQGINCTHILYPGRPDVNTNNQPRYDPEEVQRNAEIQQKQRRLERDIRYQKKRMNAALELEDPETVQMCKQVIANKQKQLRELINEHGFLVRDYSREQVQS